MSKTQAALVLVTQGVSVREAAKAAGIKEPTLYAALTRIRRQEIEGKERCPCCGQVVREGFQLDRSVLKANRNGA